MKILIIEDQEKHIADAKTALLEFSEVSADFALTYVEAVKKMKVNKYDGIISDIFFPFDDKESEYYLKGWNNGMKAKCLNLLKESMDCCSGLQEGKYFIEACNKWMEGYEMHPTGVVIPSETTIPVILCTDTYHHGHKTQVIHKYSVSNDLTIVDTMPSKDRNGSADTKDWQLAIEVIITKIKLSLPGRDAYFKV